MNSALKNLSISILSFAALSLIGCATSEPAYDPYAAPADSTVVHVPTGVTAVPPSTDSTTVTTQYPDGDVRQRTTTSYNTGYEAVGPPYKTTVVPSPYVAPASPSVVTSTTTTQTQSNVIAVPPHTDSTTVTTQYPNGDVHQRTTTSYNSGYTTAEPAYKTTVVTSPYVAPASPSVVSPSVTRSTTTTDSQGNVVQQQTTTTTNGY
jgi:hypothetical protein